MALRDIGPCGGCAREGRCEDQADKCFQAFFAYWRGVVIGCMDRKERSWRGLEGVL